MNAAKTIRQRNVKNVSTNSVSDDTLSTEKTELIAAERKLAPLDKGNIPMPKGAIPRHGRPR